MAKLGMAVNIGNDDKSTLCGYVGKFLGDSVFYDHEEDCLRFISQSLRGITGRPLKETFTFAKNTKLMVDKLERGQVVESYLKSKKFIYLDKLQGGKVLVAESLEAVQNGKFMKLPWFLFKKSTQEFIPVADLGTTHSKKSYNSLTLEDKVAIAEKVLLSSYGSYAKDIKLLEYGNLVEAVVYDHEEDDYYDIIGVTIKFSDKGKEQYGLLPVYVPIDFIEGPNVHTYGRNMDRFENGFGDSAEVENIIEEAKF